MLEPMRTTRRICQECFSASARFHYRGRWRFREDHDLCPRCYRRLMDRVRAGALALQAA